MATAFHVCFSLCLFLVSSLLDRIISYENSPINLLPSPLLSDSPSQKTTVNTKSKLIILPQTPSSSFPTSFNTHHFIQRRHHPLSCSGQIPGIILEFFSTSEPLTKSCQFNFPKIFQMNFFFSIFTTTPSVQESISSPGTVLVHSNQQGRARCPSSHHWGGLMEPQAARMYHSFASVQE